MKDRERDKSGDKEQATQTSIKKLRQSFVFLSHLVHELQGKKKQTKNENLALAI